MKYTILLITLFAITVAAQPEKKAVVWSADAACGLKTFEPKPTDIIECDAFVSDGSRIRVVEFNGMLVALSLSQDGKYILGDAYIRNNTGARVLVNPNTWTIIHYKAEADFPDKPELSGSNAIPPAEVAQKITSRARWANVFSAVGAGMATTTSTVKTNTGTTATVTSPDTSAKTRSDREIRSRNSRVNTETQEIIAAGMLPNTVFNEGQLNGVVYFPRHKKASYSLIFIKIESQSFVFEVRK